MRFNEGDPIHEAAIDLLELQSPRTKAQYVANAVVYYSEHFSKEPQPLNAPAVTREAVVAIVKEILRQEEKENGAPAPLTITEPEEVRPMPPMQKMAAEEPGGELEMDDKTRSLIASTLSAFRSRG